MSSVKPSSSSAPYTVWSIVWTFLLGLFLTAIFFRSLLPRLPQILFRGRLRIRRVGVRGIRGIEYRSKGFHNNSAAFSRHEDQVQIKVQRVYASFHLPYFLRSTKKCPGVVARTSGAIVTVHVQGVGVCLPRSQQHARQSTKTSQTPSSIAAGDVHDPIEHITPEQQEEARLQQLMSSPPMSPTLQSERPLASSFLSAPSNSDSRDRVQRVQTPDPPQGSSLYLTCQRAGLMSIHSVLRLASWVRSAALPAMRSIVLRAFRAALFILTSGIPVLTSLISIEVDHIEVYIQEAEAVARIGRAGLTFSMSPGSRPSHPGASNAQEDPEVAHRASSYFQTLSWSNFSDTMRSMPTKVGSGARDVATYLVAGISPSFISAHLRIDSIDLFEASFSPDAIRSSSSIPKSQQYGASPSSRPTTPLSSQAFAGQGVLSPTHSEKELGVAASSHDDSFEWSSHPARPNQARSASESVSRKLPSASLRGFAHLWADWALEPLVDSNFQADSGWTRQHLDEGVSHQQLQAIPAAARIASISGLTELTASLLVGSDLALGEDCTLAARLVLGNLSLGLDAAHRVMCIIEERKARRSGWAPKHKDGPNEQRSVLSKHLVQQRPSAATKALRMVSSAALSLPSVRITASSDALLSSISDCADDTNDEADTDAWLPSREFGISLAGFNLELKDSEQSDDGHRRWLGTCGLPLQKDKGARGQKKAKDSKSPRWKFRRSSLPHEANAIEHRRIFLTELSLASLDVRCAARERSHSSRLLSVGDLSVVARSSWTPFGLFAASPEVSRLLLEGDPNEHAAVLEATIGGIETDMSLNDITAIIPIADEFGRRRRNKRVQVGIQEPARPKTDLERLRRVPRLAGGFHIERISLLLDASRDKQTEGLEIPPSDSQQGSEGQSSRKFTLTVPNVDFVFLGEYKDEYVKRPAAEKRAAYKALKADSLEWPISGAARLEAAKFNHGPRQSRDWNRQSDKVADQADVSSLPATSRASSYPAERFEETGLTMEETVKRMHEIQKRMDCAQDKTPGTTRRSSLRDTMAKTGKVRTPGYSQRSILAAETCFSLRYQFETSLRIDAIESFLTLSNGPRRCSTSFARPPKDRTAPATEPTQYHLLALHSVELLGSGRIPGRVEPRASPLHPDTPTLSASDTIAEFRANIEDVDIEAWQMPALETYADIGAIIIQSTTARKHAHKRNETNGRNGDVAADDAEAVHDLSVSDDVAKSLVERLPGGLSVYLSIGRTIAHLGGTDRRIQDKIARGVGFEAKRIVVEYAGVTETKTNALPAKTNWGSRTALELSEDLQLQALSLAGRHAH
ncbi:hypothetical protein EX895_003395 [Sporisorium graminicola]|uniref:Uncharacterized protein n=1 Tax=Sporisorium graminicola TaxID=280036 RepID=A0A4U7KTE0_9BASI|nr:hypothetical protein EX895_003395 [Sporisorium graminicola]TKY87814.1 hypothetical protein EX895_003395 [Sporisorium graminicola]